MRAFINALGGIAATVLSLFVIFVAAAIGPSLLTAMFWLGVPAPLRSLRRLVSEARSVGI
jgi:hypothetical protein